MLRRWHRGSARVLGPEHADVVAQALADDPVGSCMVAERFERYGMDQGGLGGTLWGVDGGRAALAFVGGNLVPLQGEPEGLERLAEGLLHRRRSVASLVGRAELVLPLWQGLAPGWGPAREVRSDQPLLVCPGTPAVEADHRVRQIDAQLGDLYFPAAVAMFTEEVGVDPRMGDGGYFYRRRVDDLIHRGLAFAVLEGAEVLFKAEIGALSRQVGLIQGVWVAPRHRGRGLAAAALAPVVEHLRTDLGRTPSLYVNAGNTAARALYATLGFEQVGTFASVLF